MSLVLAGLALCWLHAAAPPRAPGDPAAQLAPPAAQLTPPAGQLAPPDAWGSLRPGPYAVGFRSEWVLDHGRRWALRPEAGVADATLATPGPRPVLVNAWYPAAPPADAPGTDVRAAPMPHGAYFELTSDEARLAALSAALSAAARAISVTELFGTSEDQLSQQDAARWAAALAAPTAALRDLPPDPGPFPLVLYHAGYGSSFEDNAVLCEWLASHGYVVLGSAFLRGDGSRLDIDGRDDSLADLEQLLRWAGTHPEIDLTSVGMAGHSGGAHVTLQFAARPRSPLDAAVALDTTQDHHSVADRRWWTLLDATRDNTTDLVEPILLATGPTAIFQLADGWTGAERDYLTLADLEHDEYISQGVLAAELRATRGLAGPEEIERAGRVRAAYDALCERVLLFFDAHLKHDDAAAQRLAQLDVGHPLGGHAPHLEHVPAGVCCPPPYDLDSAQPPTPRQFRALVATAGTAAALVELDEAWRADPSTPLADIVSGLSLVFELTAAGRTDDARLAGQVYRRLHPDLASYFTWFADNAAGRTELADYRRLALQSALAVDPELEEARRALDESLAGQPAAP